MGVSFPWFPGVSGHGGTSSPGKCVCSCRPCGLGLVSMGSLGSLGVGVVLVWVGVGVPVVSGDPRGESSVGEGGSWFP